MHSPQRNRRFHTLEPLASPSVRSRGWMLDASRVAVRGYGRSSLCVNVAQLAELYGGPGATCAAPRQREAQRDPIARLPSGARVPHSSTRTSTAPRAVPSARRRARGPPDPTRSQIPGPARARRDANEITQAATLVLPMKRSHDGQRATRASGRRVRNQQSRAIGSQRQLRDLYLTILTASRKGRANAYSVVRTVSERREPQGRYGGRRRVPEAVSVRSSRT
jgi:hypothetical protein